MEEQIERNLFSGPSSDIKLFEETNRVASIMEQRALAEARFSHTMRDLAEELDEYIWKKRENLVQSEDVGVYLSALEQCEREMTLQSNRMMKDGERHAEAANQLYDYENDPKKLADVMKKEKYFNNLKTAYNKDFKNIEKSKNIYNKKMLELEITEVKQLRVKEQKTWKKIVKKHRLLEQEVQKTLEQYQATLADEEKSRTQLELASRDFENVWVEVAGKRVKHVLKTLSGSFQDKQRIDAHLEEFNLQRYLQSVGKFESYAEAHFEEYKPTQDKAALIGNIAQANGQGESRQLIKAIVEQDYIKQRTNQLNLKKGQRVKQLLSANEEGLAFGETRRGRLGKKRTGYYPTSAVSLVE